MAQCHAKAKGTGKQCQRPAIRGGNVCWHHGGAAPQVRRKADERFARARDLSLDVYTSQLEQGIVAPPTAYAAARDFAKTCLELEAAQAGAQATSVVDDWLDSMRGEE
jgi:hypothetical protein